MVLRLSTIGSVRAVRVFEPPTRRDNESDDDFAARQTYAEERKDIFADVRLAPRADSMEWQMRRSRLRADEQRRIRDGEPAEFFGVMTAEGFRETRALFREILLGTLHRARGIDLDDGETVTPIAGIEDPTRLVDAIEGCDMLTPFAAAALTGQSLTPAQVEP